MGLLQKGGEGSLRGQPVTACVIQDMDSLITICTSRGCHDVIHPWTPPLGCITRTEACWECFVLHTVIEYRGAPAT
jgi:hypothetical protein